ncbi:MAG TPA: DNA gyrase subunit A [Crinalium sp.]|jgi:DNA gyrase subunit A
MAKQLNLSSGQIVATALHTEVQRSYLEYAMSVIVGRALPDVRDGLKPVHRRILYAMHELGLTPDRPYRKCARVVGDVLGKYHPHGDQAVYDALVRMVQEFSSRYPLLAGHGNFGSVDDDPPAAMRYTETRLASISNEAMLAEIGEATVDFIGNFDNSQQEPTVLPAQLPILLLNGSSGIAVGMATNIPPHNLGEIIDGLIALIDQPDLPNDELFALVPGPDFPTGGEIVGTEGIREAYATGRGSIPVRGIAQFEEVQGGRGRHRRNAIVITELPYQVNKAALIEKIAELVNQNRIEGVVDIRDESDREGMRIVIELRRESNPHRILSQLYKLTPLQSNFGAILLALADGQPRQMPLRELLQHFLTFREQTLTRQYQNDLEKTENRLHIVEGLLDALENLDDVIDILRHAPDGSTAKVTFQERFEFSDRQCDAILSMPLRRLTGLERRNLQTESDELTARREELQLLLNSRREFLKALKKDLRVLKRKFNDPRRTRIQSDAQRAQESSALAELENETPLEEEVVLEFTSRGYVRRLTPKAFQRQQAKQEAITPRVLAETDDATIQIQTATTAQELLILTRSGKAFTVKVNDIPQTQKQSKGTPLVTLLPLTVQGDREGIAAQFVLTPQPDDLPDLILLTTKGRIKRSPLAEFINLTGRGLTALKLKDDDELATAILADPGDQLVIASVGGRLLRLEVNDEQLPILSRTAQGQQALRLGKQEHVAGCVALGTEDHFLLVSQQGYVKRLAVRALRLSNPGDLGLQAMHFATKTDGLAGITPAFPGIDITLLTSAERSGILPVDDVPTGSKDGVGDRLFKLTKGEKVTALTIASLPQPEEDESELDTEDDSD